MSPGNHEVARGSNPQYRACHGFIWKVEDGLAMGLVSTIVAQIEVALLVQGEDVDLATFTESAASGLANLSDEHEWQTGPVTPAYGGMPVQALLLLPQDEPLPLPWDSPQAL